ncbi:MAG: hypothetical protein GVY34_01360 [Alphaproteobacteria bacterium]|jgi:hypothetical protein|nr:hypothetical protein [Alphaproteobacteria bacterium]
MTKVSFKDVKTVLIDEHTALMSGDFDALERVTIRKERMALHMDELDLSAADIREIRSLSEKSARLLAVVSHAVTEARIYLAERHNPPDTHAYAANGTRQKLSDTSGTLAQKA